MPVAGKRADRGAAKSFIAFHTDLGPGERIHFQQYGQCAQPAEGIDKGSDPFLDLERDEVYRHHVDEKRLEGDMEIAEYRQYLVLRSIAKVDIDIGHSLQQLHAGKISQWNPKLPGFSLVGDI